MPKPKKTAAQTKTKVVTVVDDQADIKNHEQESIDCRSLTEEPNAKRMKGNTQAEAIKFIEPEKKDYEFSSSTTLRGYSDESKNRATAKTSFIPSVDYNDSRVFGTDAKEFDCIRILSGRLVYTISNISGPPVLINLFTIKDERPDIDLENLPKTTVSREWSPMQSFMREKFVFESRFERFRLAQSESLRLDKQHLLGDFDVAKLEDRKHFPCFFAIVKGMDSSSEIQISMFNNIEYQNIGRAEMPDHEAEQISSWQDNK